MSATPEQIKTINEYAAAILEVPVDDLVTNPRWGDINFEAARRDLDLLYAMTKHLSRLPFEILPQTIAQSFMAALQEAHAIVMSIRNFRLDAGEPASQRNTLVSESKRVADLVLVNAGPWIPFLAYQQGDVQRNIDEMNEAVRDAKVLLADSKRSTEDTAKEIAEIVTAARDASASAGVGVFTLDFQNQSTLQEAEARKWLIATGVAAGATIFIAVASAFFTIKSDSSQAQVIQYMTSKILVLVVLLSATVWCGRIYKATRHQAATSGHRANALKTFQAFIKAAGDESTRNAVLLESTRSIFAIAPSGYLDSGDSDPSTKVMEIVKFGRSEKD